MNNKARFQGTGVAVVTPFKSGQVDYEALTNVLNHVVDGGVDMIVCLGTTGEATALSDHEQQEILAHTIEVVAGRKPIVYGPFGSNNTA
ncbi:MAG TPA: dihydrodipicolinate synthase family protein, partial [Saprospiraceae bacterium]|nr:dihydrodipicolinate synthase family protein [Saprospiraceae bacterium]